MSGGGKLDTDMFDRQKVKFLINPRNNFKGLRNSFNFYKKYNKAYTTYTLPSKFYRKINDMVGSFKPTIGFTTLATLIQTDFKELYITGFTFYKTPFGPGYRDELNTTEKITNYIAETGVHDIELEFAQFKNLIKNAKGKNIKMDGQLEKILQNN